MDYTPRHGERSVRDIRGHGEVTAWGVIAGTASVNLLQGGDNIGQVIKSGTGRYILGWERPFPTDVYSIQLTWSGGAATGTLRRFVRVVASGTSALQATIASVDSAGALSDITFYVEARGRRFA